MNDFTKEELQLLNGAVWMITNNLTVTNGIDSTQQQRLIDLNRKIQVAIDNYDVPTECPSAHEFYEKLVCEQCGLMEDF